MKKILAISLCVILAVCCMFACGKKDDDVKATEAPKVTEAADVTEAPADATEEPADVTEAPADATEEPADVTEAPADATEEPAASEKPAEKPERIEPKGIVTAMIDEIPVEAFSTDTASVGYDYGDAYVTISGGSEGGQEWVSMRGYDLRYVDDPEYNPDGARVLSDAANLYPKIAFAYMMNEGTEFNDFGFKNTTWDTSVNAAPDTIDYEDLNLIADGKWHVCIIDFETQMPNAFALGKGGDKFDCMVFGAPIDDGELNLAWYGCFESEAEINAWATNYAARNL